MYSLRTDWPASQQDGVMNLIKGATWSILPAYAIDGYLPCTAIREGYFNKEAFLAWVRDDLLPYCNPYPGPKSIICLDNVSVHLDPRIQQIIEETGLIIKFFFLPTRQTIAQSSTLIRRPEGPG